jgi:hypothetical protein
MPVQETLPWRQFLLATCLVAVPVGLLTGWQMLQPSTAVAAAENPLGDLAPMQAIVADVATIAGQGDLAAAKARIADLETAWDVAEPQMQPKSPKVWGRVDGAIDDALHALRAASPDAAAVKDRLTTLAAVMSDPAAMGAAAADGVQMVSGFAVTDAGGHPLPCETMLKDLGAAIAATPLGDGSPVLDLQSKALERCNADDDRNANAFSAQALAAMKSSGDDDLH